MTIQVEKKEVYGHTLTYVKKESVRKSINKLTGRKTLTDYDVEALKELGFVLVVEQVKWEGDFFTCDYCGGRNSTKEKKN
ncbi:hypothetical protein OAA60_05045 [Porticoccaceae bacterium]|nr:hypothetical protein [Porticoccaceae bacterium]